MDRGAARSKKREKAQTTVSAKPYAQSRPDKKDRSNTTTSGGDRSAEAGPSSGKKLKNKFKPRQRVEQQQQKQQPGPSTVDPNQYKPKAIRTAHALIYSEQPFDLPPTKEQLENVKRLDLAGSGVSDVSWLEGTGVTWLSLAGCPVQKGWEAVGSLSDLAVLNISQTGLTQLPKALGNLRSLKALVAMNNDWVKLDNDVIAGWQQLNSLIISHSLQLASVPPALTALPQLAKLTFSHCGRLTSSSLPDLSSLPLLRDVKMNNLPLLTRLPAHVLTWGTGDMSAVSKPSRGALKEDKAESSPAASSARQGAGLDVLDLGNCGLTFEAVAPIFGIGNNSKAGKASNGSGKNTWNLRSLTLASNPIAVSHSNYSDLLQGSDALPNLQIIDAKRVKERKRKGEVSESRVDRKRRESREKKMKPSGANVGGGQMRAWGGKEQEGAVEVGGAQGDALGAAGEVASTKKRRREDASEMTPAAETGRARGYPEKRRKDHKDDDRSRRPASDADKKKKRDKTISWGKSAPAAPSTSKPAAPAAAVPDVSTAVPSTTSIPTSKPAAGKNETSVVTVIEIAKRADGGSGVDKKKGKEGKRSKAEGVVVENVKRKDGREAAAAALDLGSVFGKNKGAMAQDDAVLDVEGW